jgi:plastocyanin
MVAQTALVVIKGFKFSPQKITVKKGTVGTWRNEDSAPHTVESDDGKYTSDNLENTDNVQFTFDKVGTVDYHCGIHPSMKGSVMVEE